MTPEEIVGFVGELPRVRVVRAGPEIGAPEAAWGDVFFYFDPEGNAYESGGMPFATIIVKDYPGFDTASRLDRPGVFRVNAAVGRRLFEELVGHSPAAHPEHAGEVDPAGFDRVIAHPVYAAQGWVSVVCPGEATAGRVREMLAAAHGREAARWGRRTGAAGA
ncbi:hypothetical protein SUDANB121_00459 [Nocardiopsis dassonvillei]|uniref:DUF6194 family protein n=1 Tax=Nocardiopsis dassonvillei TaxID=2014 RepID=UPI003F56D01C